MQTNWDRFRDASIVLAGGGSIKQRLADAYQNCLRNVSPDELPRDLRAPFVAFLSALQSAPKTGALDAVSASVRKMSEADAAHHSQAIVRIFIGLQEQPQALSRPATMLRAVPLEDEIPAFLNRA
jgi:hypothetical protein